MKPKVVGIARNRADLSCLRDLVRGAEGDNLEAGRLRKTREGADKLALTNARSRSELIELATVRRLGQNVMAAVRDRILAMPLTDEENNGRLRELLALGDMDWSRDV